MKRFPKFRQCCQLVRQPANYVVAVSRNRKVSTDATEWYNRVWRLAATEAELKTTQAMADAPSAYPSLAHEANQLLRLIGSAGSVPHDLTEALWAVYLNSRKSESGTLNFFLTLSQMGIDREQLLKDVNRLSSLLASADASSSSISLSRTLESLRASSHPLFGKWFHRTLALPDGTKRLIDMREVLLDLISQQDSTQTGTVAALREVERALTTVLQEWCSVAWLTIDEIRWDNSSAAVLDNVARFERVHPFKGIEDVRRRVHPTPRRKIFAFFHPTIANEPIVMIQVAFTEGIAASITDLLAHKDLPTSGTRGSENDPDTAIFYSISSTQAGLQGIELGAPLIKSVVGRLQQSEPNITQFSTLSPIPGYVAWLRSRSQKTPSKNALLWLLGLDSQRFASHEATWYKIASESPVESFLSMLCSAPLVRGQEIPHGNLPTA